jgi:propanediol utilization protein
MLVLTSSLGILSPILKPSKVSIAQITAALRGIDAMILIKGQINSYPAVRLV